MRKMNWNKLFECFYKFLLRDFLGKIVPGGVVVWAFCSGQDWFLGSAETIADVPVLVWLFLAGVAWVAGFAVQAISELLLPWRPTMDREHAQERVDERIEVLKQFSEEGRRDYERLIAIEKISRNGAMALALVAIAAMAKSCENAGWIYSLCGILGLAGLLHLSHYCEKAKAAYREREVPKKPTRAPAPSTGARRKVAKKKTAKRKVAKKKTAKRKRR